MRKVYPSADGVNVRVADGQMVVVTVFNIKGNHYRLLTVVNYAAAVCRVVDADTRGVFDQPMEGPTMSTRAEANPLAVSEAELWRMITSSWFVLFPCDRSEIRVNTMKRAKCSTGCWAGPMEN